eukprot:CAMPEP_0117081872 /NCGR_PEP_ID=MMETSP0472-20121206/57680_1 /TAXON_ID=693140 ORGANISM="Tiarina fusus, Strain LIS" /NCGR_SAMPLE_ID=MMETSP0472 /ASSEMBLY_ACC=CAM_ASM_000603 /LENGTH=585 /DNA_ID=CAMNT_0004809931 /DNA_START=47 /DNA_END=1799 /DNA_ORIENTATION=-
MSGAKGGGRRKFNRNKKKIVETDIKADSEAPPNPIALLSTEEKCDLIADLSEAVLEDPTKAFKQETDAASHDKKADEESNGAGMRQPSRIQKLLDLGRAHKNGGDEYVASLAVMSLLAIFKDILPAYRIRLKTDAERTGKISKETRQLWDYERAVVTHYQQYLQLLEKSWEKGQFKNEAPSKLAVTAMLSLCELLKSAFHFNFRSNILAVVVRQMNYRLSDKVSEECCKSVEYVFQKDAQGEVAMETARLVAKLTKDYKGSIRPEVVKTFLKLPLRVHVDEAQAAKLATSGKGDKELAEIESELKEGSGEVDKILLARCQSESLQSVILSYFRILKSPDAATKKNLLPVALEGLAKFAHLINIDTVVDLLDVLKQLLLDVDGLPLEAALNCVLTAFQTLQGPGREMQIDVKEYITPLYSQLPRLGCEENSRTNTDTALQCLSAAFIKRREYSNVRVAAFVKQIFALAMNAPSYTSIPMIAMARQILQRYPNTHQLLESEADIITSGQYNPDVADPEFSNPFSTSAWELANLKFHINPDIRDQAQGASTLKILKMPGEAPDRLWSKCDKDAQEIYIDFRRASKKHP